MSNEGALVEELKRLVLENERLKGMLVLMDQERSMPASIDTFGSERGFWKVDVATVTVELPPLASLTRNDALMQVHRLGVTRLVNQMFEKRIATWGSPLTASGQHLSDEWRVHAAFVIGRS